MATTLRLILGDQLNARHSWFRQTDDSVIYLIAELRQETDYTHHHVQKICAFFASMEAFATALDKAGHRVHHLTLDDTADFADLPALINALCKQHGCQQFEYQRPDEYRLLQQLREFRLPKGCRRLEYDTEHFLLPFEDIDQEFTPGKLRMMEHFYRRMRKRFLILMDGDQPRGGRWNFDQDNRNKLSGAQLADVPAPLTFANPVGAIIERLQRHGVDHFGRATKSLLWPVTRKQAQSLLEFFCTHLLPNFGRYQDAMIGATTGDDTSWSLYHSRLSFAINVKMLHPMQVIDAALAAFERSEGQIDLAQIEGFVRQILGWREFVRGVYWANMPDYAQRNALSAERALPAYFWTGETGMQCLRQAIGQSLNYAYAHHIQRLMVTGNFCLLAGVDPDEVDQWYLGIYVDALEWVEMPNTRGMSQYADGGLVGTKAYAAGGNYMQKMSNYCGQCQYKVSAKTGENSCPLNSLYWHFMDRHRQTFNRNPRLGMIYRSWDKMAEDKQQAILARGQWCLDNINSL
ncbi:cryptochrome/photolyase family protein [Spongiibacter taiwanensis]|uniref:cryptochrome/photolyase family protein n=1 Tax=Spongiibacter taiwanensis TaxID=1748242 RepID=UPI002035494A|nr:cryptochrome/photolyase family protein [Spongiibacter taiwanensis]USA42233.1 cryptochrome/photolyase family protein [Spongiibacter taiwanensis]